MRFINMIPFVFLLWISCQPQQNSSPSSIKLSWKDSSVNSTGETMIHTSAVIRYSVLEGGFWYLDCGDKKYLPLNLPHEFQQEGIKVKVVLIPQTDVMTIQMFGTPAQIVEITGDQ